MADKGLLGSVTGKLSGAGDSLGGALTKAMKTANMATTRGGLFEEASISKLLRGGKPKPAEIRLYKKKKDTREYDTIPCMFRPTEISISKGVSWGSAAKSTGKGKKDEDEAEDTVPKLNVPKRRFRGGHAAKIDLDLFFDTTDTGKDVRSITDKLFELVTIRKDTLSTSPMTPYCRFVWGKIVTFMAYVNDVKVKYTLFKPDGTPIRAEASISLEQAVDENKLSGQNPTSFSEARKLWVVTEGETLDWIAYQEYGDPAQWRHIAQTNNLMNPRDLRPGQLLKLTPLP
jgi:hypothetical protein